MDLKDFIAQWPRNQRMAVRRRIAADAGVKEVALRHYANGTRQVPSARVIPIAKSTGYAVRPCDLRRDLYPNATDGMPADSVGQAAIPMDQRGEVVAGLGQVGLNAGRGQSSGEHEVELVDKRGDAVRLRRRKGVEQQQEGDLHGRGRIAQQGGAKRKGGLLGHGDALAVVGG